MLVLVRNGGMAPFQILKFRCVCVCVGGGLLFCRYSVDVCTASSGAPCASGDAAGWSNLVGPANPSKCWGHAPGLAGGCGGQTIGSHHIDVVAANASAVRLRLLRVVAHPSGALPLLSFRILSVGSN